MKRMLEQLYDGEIYPAEKIVVNTPADRERSRKIGEERTYFKSILSAADGKRFDNLDDMEQQSSSAYAFENFACGFRLGAGLLLEALGFSPAPPEE